ncbi:MAG: FAD-dependent oxidoreductase [Planctomycetota bacterium]|nr:MAG: FAD-dependent oxidoreductase [Planctomycetota bacterium]
MKHIVIIGNGIAGVTAARHLRKLGDDKITIISAETKYFFSRTALMYIYMGHMTLQDTQPYENWFWEKNRIDLIQDKVESVDYSEKKLLLASKTEVSYDSLILATGAKPNMFGWKGQDLDGAQGLYSYQNLQYIEERSHLIKRAVIVGGGLIGIELAEMFLSRNIKVTFLVREKSFWNKILPNEESAMINRHIFEHHIDLRLGAELEEIIGDDSGKVKAIKIKDGEVLDCEFVGLTAGVSPNIDFLKDSDLNLGRGIKIDQTFKTNMPDVYAIGDCAEFEVPLEGRLPIEQVWYTGKMHGETVAHVIQGEEKTYKPGTWFNSAKFLDIEYQTYGMVLGQLFDGQETFYWEAPNGKISVRINFSKETMAVEGFNFMGLRARHEVCVPWIENKITLKEVIENFGAANFDPEFYKKYEAVIVQQYNEEYPNDRVELKTKKGLFSNYIQKFKRFSLTERSS